MTPNRPISTEEMFDTYRSQYNQLIENISQITRDQREIFNQMQLNNERLANQIQLNNERLATHYNYNSQNINYLYINLDSIRLNMLDLYRPYTPPITSSFPTNSINPTNPINYSYTTPSIPSRSFSPTPSPTPTTPINSINNNTTPTTPPTTPPTTIPTTTPSTNANTQPTNNANNSSRNRSRYNIEFLYSYVPLAENTDLVDVPVYPTLEQINNAVTTVPFSSIVNPLNDRCPIGLEYFDLNEMVTQIRQCEHIFCTTEIQEWFQNNVHCPVCRYDIREYTTSRDNISINNNRTRNRTRSRVRNSENSIFNEIAAHFLNSYLDPSYNVDLSNNTLR